MPGTMYILEGVDSRTGTAQRTCKSSKVGLGDLNNYRLQTTINGCKYIPFGGKKTRKRAVICVETNVLGLDYAHKNGPFWIGLERSSEKDHDNIGIVQRTQISQQKYEHEHLRYNIPHITAYIDDLSLQSVSEEDLDALIYPHNQFYKDPCKNYNLGRVDSIKSVDGGFHIFSGSRNNVHDEMGRYDSESSYQTDEGWLFMVRSHCSSYTSLYSGIKPISQILKPSYQRLNILVRLILISLMFNSVQSKRYGIYNETRWDPLVFNEDIVPAERLDIIRSSSGYFDSHYVEKPEDFKQFGDISIITLNMYRDVVYDTETIESAENFRTILDEAHLTVLCLQGVDDSLLKRISGKLKKQSHYQITNIDKYDVDLLTGQRTYLPIIYDSRILFMKMGGYFETEGESTQVYGSYSLFRDVRVQDTEDFTFTVINIDLFSSFNDVVSAEFSNIAQDVMSYERVANAPVIVAGSIGTVPPNISDLMKSEYLNLLTKDANNEDLPLTTLHAGGQDDGVQRDFMLMRDTKHAFVVNYARILREFLAGDHYPIHTILSYSDEKFGMRERKYRDAATEDIPETDQKDMTKEEKKKYRELRKRKKEEKELNEPISPRKRVRNTEEEKQKRNAEFQQNVVAQAVNDKIEAEQKRKLEPNRLSEPISK